MAGTESGKIRVDDYSTETGLRVRLTCATGALQIPADLFHEFVARCKAGEFDGLAKEAKIPFVHWPEGAKLPIVGGGTVGEG